MIMGFELRRVTQGYAELRTAQKAMGFDNIEGGVGCYASYDPHARMRMCVCASTHACTQRRNLRNGVLPIPLHPLFIVLCSLLLSLFFCVTNKKRVVTDSNFLKIQTISKGGFFEIV